MVADLRAVVATLDERPVLVGASIYGTTALLAQGADPDLARALVLVDVTPTIEPEGTAEITRFVRSDADRFSSMEEAAEAVATYNPHRRQPPGPKGCVRTSAAGTTAGTGTGTRGSSTAGTTIPRILRGQRPPCPGGSRAAADTDLAGGSYRNLGS